MNEHEYTTKVMATEAADWEAVRGRLRAVDTLRLLHAALGFASEVGELAEVLGSDPGDRVHLLEELGDLSWYGTVGLDATGGALQWSPLQSYTEDPRELAAVLTVHAGEILSAVKAHLYYGRELNAQRIRIQFDEALHVVREIAHALGFEIEEVMSANVRKLHGRRYKGGTFTEAAANDRDLAAERDALKGETP
jgi:NTP pyrophosphatase (non-canonical NTP hydrolase)